jgi:hypothetical protein
LADFSVIARLPERSSIVLACSARRHGAARDPLSLLRRIARREFLWPGGTLLALAVRALRHHPSRDLLVLPWPGATRAIGDTTR